jgi:hypothetical protein
MNDIVAMRDRLAVLRGIQAQAISEIGSLMLARGGQLTDPDDAFLFEQWSILAKSAETEANGLSDIIRASDVAIEAKWRKLEALAADVREANQREQQRLDARRRKMSGRPKCAHLHANGSRCGHTVSLSSGETLCHNHRDRSARDRPRQPYEGWPDRPVPVAKSVPGVAETPECERKHPDATKPWREWPSIVEDVEPVVPVRAISDNDHDSDHIIADTVEKRAKAIMAWAPPWARRARYTRLRRYEGFTAGDR